MSRLDSVIRRLTAQRDLLNHVARDPTLPEGLVLELGLGNGRTFSHLREAFPARRVVAFDRALGAHGPSIPPAGDLVLGEIGETARRYVGQAVALIHADIGTGYDSRDAVTLTWLPGLVADLLVPGGIAVSGLRLDHPGLEPLAVPATVPEGRYFLCRRAP